MASSRIMFALAVVAFIAVVSGASHEHGVVLGSALGTTMQFVRWMKEFGRSYTADEAQTRFATWSNNLALVEAHNALYESGQSTFAMSMNKFADWTNEEYKAYLSARPRDMHSAAGTFTDRPQDVSAPDAVDWRDYTPAVITPVKDQGDCGSCWTFSATASMEGAHAYTTKNLVSLSEEEWVDCLQNATGCDGGWMEWAFEAAISMGGAMSEKDYPYVGRNGQKCMFDKSKVAAKFSKYYNVTVGDELALTAASALRPAVSVAIDASQPSFQLYSKGVYYDANCQKDVDSLDHAVTVVGYGVLNGTDYYIVKNSWSEAWGLQGYILMSRGRNNSCGIATRAMYIEV